MHYEPNPWMILPFGILLAAIALGPLFLEKWWLKHYPKVAFALAAVTLSYYWFILPEAAHHTIGHTAKEYLSFIALIGSLFVVSGGIHINVKGEATPRANVVFLLIGAIIANLLGTTGASMLLIRPWLRMNKYRITAHHVVFFIFIVSNVGGCLTPIGDPPLFLGYLRGIPFWWVAERCWPMWMVGVGTLLATFYVVDRLNYIRAPKAVREVLAEPPDQWRLQGLWNLAFLGVILGAVFIEHPPYLREFLMLAAAAGSYYTTQKAVHQANHFNFHPIQEVAILFIGIFSTMMPALDYLQAHAQELISPSPGFFYWSCGILSSVLDNAPTYLSFLSAEIGSFINPEMTDAVILHVQQHGLDAAAATGPFAEPIRQAVAALQNYPSAQASGGTITAGMAQIALLLGNADYSLNLVAISVAAVFFGANTYIGNGPNFMVKSIAEHQKAHVPTFLGYFFKYSIPYLLPTLVIVWWIFFR